MLVAILITAGAGIYWWFAPGPERWLAALVFCVLAYGILTGLFKNREQRIDATRAVTALAGDGTFSQEVVGEASYQDALDRIAGPKTEDGAHQVCPALICHEPNNSHDQNACAIQINDMTVGYLPRRAAARLVKSRLASGDNPGFTCTAAALITGGWRRKGSEGNYGVSLDYKLPARTKGSL